MDSFRAHFVDEVVEYMSDINLKAKAITPGYTSDLQPLDVAINKPFKNYMEEDQSINQIKKFTKNVDEVAGETLEVIKGVRPY